MTRFGIEEEYMFANSALEGASIPDAVLVGLRKELGEGIMVKREFMASQLEYSSPVFGSAPEAARSVTQFRSLLCEATQQTAAFPTSTGTPFQLPVKPPGITPEERYEKIAHHARQLAHEHHLNGLHVHVEIPNEEEGVKALNTVRTWLPLLLSLSANSPFWHGKDTGFASWRSILNRRWTTFGCPPHFADPDDYHYQAEQLTGIGTTMDLATLSWSVRLSAQHPTIEFRVFDAQLSVDMTIFLAVLCRALVRTALEDPNALTSAEQSRAPASESLINSALWHCGKNGTQGTTFDPWSLEPTPIQLVLERLLARLAPAFDDEGDLACAHVMASRLRELGNGAQSQRLAFRAGSVAALHDFLRSSFGATHAKTGATGKTPGQ